MFAKWEQELVKKFLIVHGCKNLRLELSNLFGPNTFFLADSDSIQRPAQKL